MNKLKSTFKIIFTLFFVIGLSFSLSSAVDDDEYDFEGEYICTWNDFTQKCHVFGPGGCRCIPIQ